MQQQISVATTNVERGFLVFNSSFNQTTKYFSNSLDKLIQLISMEPHIYDLDLAK